MLQKRSPAHRAEPTPRPGRFDVSALVNSLAVGMAVAVAVLAAFALNFVLQDGAQAERRSTVAGIAGNSANAGSSARVPALTSAAGVQLWAKPPLGGIHQDQGSSIPLPDGRTLWIFADTFQIGQPNFFITSSAAVSNRDSWQLRYAQAKGVPTEFLPRTAAERGDHQEGDHYQAVWPTGSTLLPDGRIIISYATYRVLVKEKDFEFLGAGLFEYRYRGLSALIDGAHAKRIAADLWTADDGEVRSPVYADGYVYFTRCQDLKCQSLRTTPDQLTDRTSYRWRTGSGWSKDRAKASDLVVGSGFPGGNPSVVRLPTGGYAMTDTEVGVVATSGWLWVAPNPWGPWSAAAGFTFPNCPAPGCYGLNLHPAQSTADQLRISYATHENGPFVRVADVPVAISPDHSSILVR